MAFTLTLQSARQMARQYARNAMGSSLYPAADIDFAISECADELIRRAWILLSVATIATTASDNTIPTVPSDFRPDRMKAIYLSGTNVIVSTNTYCDGYSPYYSVGAPQFPPNLYQTANLRLAPYIEVLNKTLAYQNNAILAQPTDIAFDQISGTGLFFPTPDQVYTVNLRYNKLFTTWQTGTQGVWNSAVNYYVGDLVSSGGHIYQAVLPSLNVAVGTASTWTDLGVGTLVLPSAITFNLPDDVMLPVIRKGVRAVLLSTDKDNSDLAGASQKQWEDYIVEMMARFDLGENFVTQTPSHGTFGGGSWDSGGGNGVLV